MTIIKPHKNFETWRFLISLFVILGLASGFYILEYNRLVESRFEVGELKKSVERAREVNAELKNALYEKIDPAKLKPLASAYGLTIDRDPEYLTFTPWRSVSAY